MDGGQRPGPIQDRQLASVAAVRLDAIAGPTGNQRRRDHLARDPLLCERPLQLEATRPGLVAALHGAAWRASRFTNRRIVGVSDASVCSAGVRWPGNKTAATVVAAC